MQLAIASQSRRGSIQSDRGNVSVTPRASSYTERQHTCENKETSEFSPDSQSSCSSLPRAATHSLVYPSSSSSASSRHCSHIHASSKYRLSLSKIKESRESSPDSISSDSPSTRAATSSRVSPSLTPSSSAGSTRALSESALTENDGQSCRPGSRGEQLRLPRIGSPGDRRALLTPLSKESVATLESHLAKSQQKEQCNHKKLKKSHSTHQNLAALDYSPKLTSLRWFPEEEASGKPRARSSVQSLPIGRACEMEGRKRRSRASSHNGIMEPRQSNSLPSLHLIRANRIDKFSVLLR